MFKSQTTDQFGKYELHGLAPGSYQIFAWMGIEKGKWEDPGFLNTQEAKGESMEVADDDWENGELKIDRRAKRLGNKFSETWAHSFLTLTAGERRG